MKICRIFRPKFAEQECEMLGMTFISPVGVNIKDKETGIRYAEALLDRAYSYVIVNCMDLAATVAILRRLPREYNIIAHLDVKQSYLYNGNSKSMEAAFAILYDFVDAFLISNIDSLSDDVDSLLDLRLFNDTYRPILLDVPSDLLYTDLDEILHYSMQNGVDGCMIGNMRLLKYAHEHCAGYLSLIASGIDSIEKMAEAKKNGADLICTDSSRHSIFSIARLGRKLLRQLHKDA